MAAAPALDAWCYPSAVPPIRIQVCPLNADQQRILLASADATALAKLFEQGIEIPSETLIAHASLVYQRDRDGRRSRKELVQDSRLVAILHAEFDVRNGTMTATAPADEMVSGVIEQAGVAASIAVADEVWGTHDADWERIYPWNPSGRRQKALDHQAATLDGRFVAVEARGMVTATPGQRQYDVNRKAREVIEKKNVQRANGNPATMLGVITEFPFDSDEPLVAWVMDPPADAPAMDPGRYKLLARLVFFARQLGLIRKPAMLHALAGRLDALARMGTLDALDSIVLRDADGETFRLPKLAGDVVEGVPGIEGRLLPLSAEVLAFCGFDRSAWSLIRSQAFAKIREWSSPLDGVHAASFKGFVGRSEVERAGLVVSEAWRTRSNGRRVEVPVEGNIAVTKGGYAFGLLRVRSGEGHRQHRPGSRSTDATPRRASNEVDSHEDEAMSDTEADTRATLVDPALAGAGWAPEHIRREFQFTDGRITVSGRTARRGRVKRCDYVLRWSRDHLLAVVEAKSIEVPASDGLQQAIEYATTLGIPFAYATNGTTIIERDLLTGVESTLHAFPSREELYARWRTARGLTAEVERVLSTPLHTGKRQARYYQLIAINRAIEALARGDERVLLTLATGTGKSFIAFQICWRLWNAGWNRKGRPAKPRILFVADRDVLVSDPYTKDFAPFESARWRIEGEAVVGREVYFATYQAIAEDTNRPGLFRQYQRDFFDLVIVDECHRGSARDDSTWRDILDWFTGAAKLGLTATPLREDNRDTYDYFGAPVYQYSLKQGIDDGFLAPYKVRRVLTDADAIGWRPGATTADREGKAVPDQVYGTKDFERRIVLDGRTKAIAGYIARYLKRIGPYSKTLVFCVDQEHAQAMRDALVAEFPDEVRRNADFVCRVTANEANVGRAHLSNFQDINRATPTILTTSEMLTTGVDAPTVQVVVLVRVVGTISTFKQIIGRGTRLCEQKGKLFFDILDFTGTATRNFADPEFDGFPEADTEEDVDGDGGDEPGADEGGATPPPGGDDEGQGDGPENPVPPRPPKPPPPPPPPAQPKIYVDGEVVTILADVVQVMDANGKLRTVRYTQYAGEKVRTLYRSATALQAKWVQPELRREVIDELGARGIDLGELAERAKADDADPFDLLCHVAFNAPLLTRRERAERLRRASPSFWDQYPPQAREVLSAILDKYAEHGEGEIALPDVLDVPPISEFGNIIEVAGRFGGTEQLRDAVGALHRHLYDVAQAG